MPKKSCRLYPACVRGGRFHGVAGHCKKACASVHDHSACGSKHVWAERHDFSAWRDHGPEGSVRTGCDADAHEFGHWRYAQTQTDKDGAYQFLEVRPATYSLTAEAPGFATYKQTNL